MVIIIGAGLSGLITAYQLQKHSIPFKILESRDRVGGRILTKLSENTTPIEMGATWFGDQHYHLIQLLNDLKLPYFKQHTEGIAFYQPHINSHPQQIQIPEQSPSYRISGGTSQIITSLLNKIDKESVFFNQTVKTITIHNKSILIEASTTFEADLIVLSIPPKLWSYNIEFSPKLPNNLQTIAQNTHTWMEESIKVAIVYNSPFWRQRGFSGSLFSNSGPITEFYDHSNADNSKYALCGFINPNLKNNTKIERKQSVLSQLKSIFGDEALHMLEYHEFVWSEDLNTYFPSNQFIFPHQNNGNIIFSDTLFDNRLLFSGTEVSPHYGGYMEGAVFIANETARKIKETV